MHANSKGSGEIVWIGISSEALQFVRMIFTILSSLLNKKKFFALSLSEVLFIMLINVKMPTIYEQDKFCVQLI